MDQAISYKIAEAARMAGVSPSTLRLWETQGLVEPHRTQTGQRVFDQAQIERLKKISWLRSERGLNPAAIRETLDSAQSDDQSGQEPLPAQSSDGKPARDVGRKLRHLRRTTGRTLENVARDLGIAVSTLSTLERTSQGVSLKVLHDVARYYGTTVSALTGERKGKERQSLVRAGQWTTWPKTTTGVTVQNLARGRHQMDCHRFVLAHGASSEGAYEHEGEEFMHVLAGRLEIILDFDQFFELGAGDSFYFESKRHHSWRNIHEGETILIWVNTPPTF